MPLTELWRDDGQTVEAAREESIGVSEMRALLRSVPVQFVVADLGSLPEWIPLDQCFEFWKEDVGLHLAEPEETVSLERFPGEYCYFASKWTNNRGVPIILLEKHH